MEDSAGNIELRRIENSLAASRLLFSCLRLRNAVKYNPDWFLQPRAPADSPGGIGGQWVAGLGAAGSKLLPVLQRVGSAALRKLREEGRRLAPILRRLPRRWDHTSEPDEDSFDDDTRRISQSSWQRYGYPTMRFRTETELRRYMGQAGQGREWHHIVEKRLAGREGFAAELIHSTDNIISLPIDVHPRVTAKMSSRSPRHGNVVLRFWMEKLPFDEQYNLGLDLIIETLEELGYDSTDF